MACSDIGKNDRRVNQYYKIQLLDSIVTKIIGISDKYGVSGLKARLDETCGTVPTAGYDSVVPEKGAHGVLSGLMNIAEHRFAAAVVTVVKADPAAAAEIKAILKAAGTDEGVDAKDAEEAYTALCQHVLDGMPCDNTKEIISSSPEKVTWRAVADLHSEAWLAAGSTLALYREYIAVFIENLLGSAFTYTDAGDGTFAIVKNN